MNDLLPFLPLMAYVLVLLFVTLYAVLSSIEFGVALFMALPDPPVSRQAVERYFGPAWESTNVFLIFSMVGLVMFFPKVIPVLSSLYVLVSTALVFLVVRVIGIAGIFYARSDAALFTFSFAAGSLLAPLSLSGVFYFALTGMQWSFPPSTLAWGLALAVVGAIISLAAPFVRHVGGAAADRPRLIRYEIAASGLFLIGAAVILFFRPALVHPGILPGIAFASALVATALAILVSERDRPLRAFFLHALSVTVLIYGVALSRLPFLIYPTLTIDDAFTAPEMFIAMLQMVPLGLLAAIPALVLLWHLFGRRAPSHEDLITDARP